MSDTSFSGSSLRKRLGLAITGHTFKVIEEWIVDRGLYSVVTGISVTYFVGVYGEVLGIIYGGLVGMLVMLPVTAMLCYAYIKGYDWAEMDLFGFELIKELKEESNEKLSWGLRILRYLARKGDIPAFFFLSAWKDAFMTTVYFRKGANNYKGLTKRDWRIFWASLVVSNAWWAMVITGFTTSVYFVYRFLPEPVQEYFLVVRDWMYGIAQAVSTTIEATIKFLHANAGPMVIGVEIGILIAFMMLLSHLWQKRFRRKRN